MRTILCFGDSNTWGSVPGSDERFPRCERWGGVMQEYLGDHWTVLEEGLCGRTTVFEDPLSPGRSGKKYLVPCLESHSPVDLFILLLGTNDLKTRFNVSAQEIAMGMEQLVQIVLNSGCGVGSMAPDVLVISPAPISSNTVFVDYQPMGYQKSLRLGSLHLQAAERTGVHFLDASRHAEVDLVEGVHLTRESHRKLGEAATAKVCGIYNV